MLVVVGEEGGGRFPGIMARAKAAPTGLELKLAIACAVCNGLLQLPIVRVLVVSSRINSGIEKGPRFANQRWIVGLQMVSMTDSSMDRASLDLVRMASQYASD